MTYYVDVSKYQGTDMSIYKKKGASGVIAQVTVGTSIVAPKCKEQLESAHKHGMHRLMYHYATFGHNKNQAVAEAKFACKRAKQLGFKSIHIFCDWESQDNDTSGSAVQNTDAIDAFMHEVNREGFTAGLYTSYSLAKNKIGYKYLGKKYGTCLWIASYPTMAAVSSANMAYFPSLDYVTAWQFTDNWYGLNVDANKIVYDPFKLKAKQGTEPKKKKPVSRETTYKITGKDIKITKE